VDAVDGLTFYAPYIEALLPGLAGLWAVLAAGKLAVAFLVWLRLVRR